MLVISNIFFIISYANIKYYFLTQTHMISGDNIETHRFLNGANTHDHVIFSILNQLSLNSFTTSFFVKYDICHQSRQASHDVLGLFQNKNEILLVIQTIFGTWIIKVPPSLMFWDIFFTTDSGSKTCSMMAIQVIKSHFLCSSNEVLMSQQ